MAAKIQHCPISSKFEMWVDNDVPTLKNFYRSPFSKWPPQYRKNSALFDFKGRCDLFFNPVVRATNGIGCTTHQLQMG
jgi:hypothetical protein